MKSVDQMTYKKQRPIKILQYGEGNFLRAFVEYMVDISNEKGVFNGNVQIVKPIALGSLDVMNTQNCVYTVLLRGKHDGETRLEKRMITCVAGAVDPYNDYEAYAAFAKNHELRFIVSNTTEAGIVYDASDDIALMPPKSYPGKLTKFLYERFLAFGGDVDKGMVILPVELIEKNGERLKECCLKLAELWKLPHSFLSWLEKCNTFCNTLVDRIVTGYPRDEAEALEKELGYTDKLMVAGEPFALWVIESEDPDMVAAEFPMDKAGLPVIFTRDLQPYRERKVRILNGAHTATVSAAYLSGLDTVRDVMMDKTMRVFMERAVYGELAPMVPLPDEEVRRFANSVMERFENPFIRHNLLSIALNSVSKFKVRVLPTIIETWEKTDSLPEVLCFSIAALMALYFGEPDDEGNLIAMRGDNKYMIMDDESVIKFFTANCVLKAEPERFVCAFLLKTDFWGQDLTQIMGLSETVTKHLQSILGLGMRGAVEKLLN